MNESLISKVEKQDLAPPAIEPGGTAIVLQRHERYDRSSGSDISGSLLPESATEAFNTNTEFFEQVVGDEYDSETMILFVSSDTQYSGKGRRSLETAQVAQDAAAQVLRTRGIDPSDRIINLNPNFKMDPTAATGQPIRSMAGLREPRIFEKPAYVEHLKEKYGALPDGGLSQAAWAAHESDQEKTTREQFGAEGVHDIVDRTKLSIKNLARYSSWFHAINPNKKLLIWAVSHYDTISPLVKDATGTDIGEYVPVDYGAGVVLNLPPESSEVTLQAQNQKVALGLGKASVEN